MPFIKKYASKKEAENARKQSLLNANRAAVRRLTPIEREYRALMARISSYKKFICERRFMDLNTKHRITFLSISELQHRLKDCQEYAAQIKPECMAAVARRAK